MRNSENVRFRYNTETLEFEIVKSKKFRNIVFGASCFLGFVLLTGIKKADIKSYDQDMYEQNINVVTNLELNHKNLKAEIAKYNFKHPNIIYAQAILESGNFKSNICKQSNNLFGMREAKQRTTTALGTELNHAYYVSWQYSVIDRALFETSFLRKIQTKEQYWDYISKNYAEDTTYVKKLKEIINKQKL